MSGTGGPAAREMPIIHRICRRQLAEFLVVLEGHLDEEEQVVVPLIDRYLTEAECKEVGERGFEKFTPAQRWTWLTVALQVFLGSNPTARP